MEAEKNSQAKRRKKTGRRILIIVSALVAVLIVFVFLLVPVLVSSEKGRQIILSKINQSIDGRADFADLSMGWFKGIRIADLSFDDTAGQISLKVKQIATEPHYASLLTGNLAFGQTTIDQPRVWINLKDRPPAETVTTTKKVPKEAAGIAIVTDITVNDGNVKVTDTDDKTVELAQINSNINLRPSGKQSNFDLNMVVAADDKQSQVQADGRITPAKTKEKSGWTLKGADYDIGINVEDIDLESLQPFLDMAGVDIEAKGNISVDLQSRFIDGQIDNITGTVKGTQLEIGTGQNQEKIQTSVLDVDLKLTQKEQMINIQNVQVTTDWAQIKANGSMPMTIKSLDSFLSAEADYDLSGTFDCNLADVVSQIPTTLGLKEGTEISSGKIAGDIKTTGSAGQKQIQAQVQLADLKGTVEGKQIAISAPITAEAQVSPDKDGVNIKKLMVSAPFAIVNASGNLEQIKFDGQADLARLQSELGQFVDIGPYKITGQLTETGQVSLNDKTVALSASSTIKGLNITGPNNVTASMPAGQATYALNYDRENVILNINSLDAGMSFGRVNIKDAVVPLKKETTEAFNMTVKAEQMDLGKLRPFAVLFGGLPEDIGLAGIAESQVSISSQKQIYTIKSDSTKITDLKVAFPDNKPIERSEATAIFEIELDAEQKTDKRIFFRLNSPGMNIPQANISQKNQDGKTQLTGQIDCEYDWAAVNSIAGQYLPEGLVLEGKRKGAINFTSEYPTDQTDQLLSNLSAKAGLGFEKAEYKGLNFGPTDVNIVVRNGLLKIIPFTTVVNEGQFNFAAQADFKQQPALFTTDQPMQIIKDIKINDQTTGTLLKYLNPIFANSANVSGIANLNCEKLSIPLSEAAKNKTEIIGTVSISQLRLQTSDVLSQILTVVGGSSGSTVITIHPTRFVLQNGYLRYDNMQMDIGDNPVNFTGTIGLDKSLDMKVTLPYTTQGRTIRIGNTSARRITLTFTGTVDNPKLDLGKLLEDQLKQEAGEQLQKALEDIFNR